MTTKNDSNKQTRKFCITKEEEKDETRYSTQIAIEHFPPNQQIVTDFLAVAAFSDCITILFSVLAVPLFCPHSTRKEARVSLFQLTVDDISQRTIIYIVLSILLMAVGQ